MGVGVVGVAVGSGVGVVVGAGAGVGSEDGVGNGVGLGVAVGVLVGACVAGGCGVGDGVGATVGTGVAVGSGAAVGASVGVGVGVSPGAWVAAGGDPAVGSGVAAGAAVAVGVAATVVATAGEVCSPPQAARAITADRHSSSTAEALPSPVSLPQINFMALFSAPGAVGSMLWTVYQPGVRFDSAGASGCAPWERRWQKPPARGRGPKPQSSGRE